MTPHRRVAIVTAMVLTLAVSGLIGQERTIEAVKTVPTRLLAPGRYSRLRCDSDGNVYLRVSTGDRRSPVVRVSADGKTLTTFSTDSDPDVTGIQDFWITDQKELFVLAEKGRDEGYVLSFDADAKLKDEVRLDLPIRPNQIAVFSSGDLLVAGRQPVILGMGRAGANGLPLVGIFNSRGQLIKRVEFHKDVKPDPKRPIIRADLSYADAIVNSSTISSDDGQVYFVRRGATGPVYAISPGGTVTKTLPLIPPQGARLSTVKVSRNNLAAEYIVDKVDSQIEGPPPVGLVITQIYDINNSKKITEYSSMPPLGPDLACYEGTAFKYLATDDDQYLQLLETEGR